MAKVEIEITNTKKVDAYQLEKITFASETSCMIGDPNICLSDVIMDRISSLEYHSITRKLLETQVICFHITMTFEPDINDEDINEKIWKIRSQQWLIDTFTLDNVLYLGYRKDTKRNTSYLKAHIIPLYNNEKISAVAFVGRKNLKEIYHNYLDDDEYFYKTQISMNADRLGQLIHKH